MKNKLFFKLFLALVIKMKGLIIDEDSYKGEKMELL